MDLYLLYVFVGVDVVFFVFNIFYEITHLQRDSGC